MRYLVDMTIVSRPATPEEGIAFIKTYVLPTLAMVRELENNGTIVAGGIKAGQIGFVLIVQADSIQQLDELVDSLPLWPRMQTTVTPLTTFEDRETVVRGRLEAITQITKNKLSEKNNPLTTIDGRSL